ncbi:MAG: substrate-binding domain-containing protein [Kiritimatiellia bacterium]|jgi:LacI family transcriptional regulator
MERKQDETASVRRLRILVALWLVNASERRMLDGIRAYVKEHGFDWDLRVVQTEESGTICRGIEGDHPDGVITSFGVPSILRSLAATTMPVVFVKFSSMGSQGFRRPNLSMLDLDFSAAGREAAHYYLDRHVYSSYGFVEAPRNPLWSTSRGDAFREVVEQAGKASCHFSAPDSFYHPSVTNRHEIEAIGRWLRELPKPAAIFAADDSRARDVMLACRQEGVDVPRTVSVLGVNNNEFTCQSVLPNLSSVELDHALMGRRAAEELQRLLDGERPRNTTFAFSVRRLVERASTGPTSPGGTLVRSALDYIEANACNGIGVMDVVRHVGVSRSLLDLRFRELDGRTVLGAIQERRLDEVARRLRETNETIGTIGRQCGFADPSGLRRLFRRRFGCSMRECRKATLSSPKSKDQSPRSDRKATLS